MSKIDFTPAHITATGVLPSSVKSALISNAVNNILFTKQENQNTEISETFYLQNRCKAEKCALEMVIFKTSKKIKLLDWASLCTPPIPPVTKTGIPMA